MALLLDGKKRDIIKFMGIRGIAILTLMYTTTVAGGDKLEIQDHIRSINPKISESQALDMAVMICRYASIFNIKPRLIAALIAVESKFNPKAVGGLGEIGLMQLRPEFFAPHLSPRSRNKHLSNIENNLHLGTKYLHDIRSLFNVRYPDYEWIELYNRGPSSKPRKFPYTKKVLAMYKQMGGEL